ncbi:MAG: hypothetical protein P1U89_21885 [Verrucomicrobiales bacterium]|nr:hypothetical protein [Verrucomicrobiales bacterium]
MIVDELKSKIDTLTDEERHQISSYLAKLELESNPDYWKAVRKRVAEEKTTKWISAEDI